MSAVFLASVPAGANQRINHMLANSIGMIMETKQMHVVCYGKFIDDKDDGVRLVSVHFGGAATEIDEADQIARDCINSVKGGVVIIKTLQMVGKHQLIDTMRSATDKLKCLETQMRETQITISRPHKRK